MKKTTFLVLLMTITFSSYSQMDVSVLLKDKISRSDLKNFNNAHEKFKKVLRTECLFGDCKTTKSAKKITFLKTKESWSNWKFEAEYYYYIIGDFKNGKLNGKAGIYFFAEDKRGFLKKYFNVEELDNALKNGDLEVINSAKLLVKESIYADFKDNIAEDGTYFIDFSLEEYERNFENAILTNFRPSNENLPGYDYLKKIPINQSKYTKRILYFYTGKLQTVNYLYYGFSNNLYSSIEIYFWNNGSNYIKYGIVPERSYTSQTDYFLDYNNISLKYEVARNGVKDFNSVHIEFTDNRGCLGCDISNNSQIANNILNDAQKQKKRELDTKINRAKSFLGHFIIDKGGHYYYVHNYDNSGCIYVNVYPTRAYFEEGYTKFYDSCDHENYSISYNIDVCPSCSGTGIQSAEIVNKTDYYRKDINYGDVYEKTEYSNTGKHTTVSCQVCGGSGIVLTN